jgi:hypothetical protein
MVVSFPYTTFNETLMNKLSLSFQFRFKKMFYKIKGVKIKELVFEIFNMAFIF